MLIRLTVATPFTIPPLSSDLGIDSNTSAGIEILQGKYDSASLPQVAKQVQHLQQTEEMKSAPIQPTFTEQEFVGKLKAWRESNTKSPSGLQCRKALCAQHRYTDIDDSNLEEQQIAEKHELNMMQQYLLELHLNMMNYALSCGFSYQQWTYIANTILFKDSDNVQIHRTKVIHIYEADYNLALGLKWRAAI